MSAIPVDHLWFSLTTASLSKQLGALHERHCNDQLQVKRIARAEEALAEVLYRGPDHEHCSLTLMGLVKCVNELKRLGS